MSPNSTQVPRRVALRSRRYGLVLLFTIVACVLGFFFHLRLSRVDLPENVAGVYLANGGAAYVVIEPTWLNPVQVSDGWFEEFFWVWGNFLKSFPTNVYESQTKDSLSSEWEDGKWVLSHQVQYYTWPVRTRSRKDWEKNGLEILTFRLSPSVDHLGDWDLEEATLEGIQTQGSPLIYLARGVWTGKLFKDSKNYLSLMNQLNRPARLMELDPAKAPLKSFLHRVDHPLAAEFLRERMAGKIDVSNLARYRPMFEALPEDPYIQMHAMDLEAKFGDPERAAGLYEKWRDALASSKDILLARTAQRAFHSVWASQGIPTGEEVLSDLAILSGVGHPVQTESIQERLLAYDVLLSCGTPGVVEGRHPIKWELEALDFHIMLGVKQATARLNMFQGDTPGALRSLETVYRVGQILANEGNLQKRTLGLSLCRGAIHDLKFVLQSLPDKKTDISAFLATLSKLGQLESPGPSEFFYEGEMPLLLTQFKESGDPLYPMIQGDDPLENKLAVDAAFRTLLVGGSAESYLLQNGSYPTNLAELDLPEGNRFSTDPFAEDTLRSTPTSQGGFAVYSVGPDLKDDAALVPYSPSNGTKSNGDIALTLTNEKKYHFPQGGIHATTVEDLFAYFPNGLPGDPFRGNGNEPLSVMDATPGSPLKVFSFGPSGTVGDNVTDVRFYSHPSLEPVEWTTPQVVNTNRSTPGIQFVFTPRTPPPPAPEEVRWRKAREAMTTESESLVQEYQQQHLLREMGGLGYGGYGKPGSLLNQAGETKEEERIRKKLEDLGIDPIVLSPEPKRAPGPLVLCPYSPTNGTKSLGQIMVEISP